MLNMLMPAKMRIYQVAEWINLKSVFERVRSLCKLTSESEFARANLKIN